MLTLMLSAFWIAFVPVADEPSPEALFTRFRDNARSFKTLKVQWRRDFKPSEEGAAAEVARIAAIERKLTAMDNTTDEYHRLNLEVNARRQGLAATYHPKRMFQTYLADQSRFMMRTAPPNWDVLQRTDDWLMPDVPVTERSMQSKYVGFTILSHGDPAAPGFRTLTPMGGSLVSAQVQRQLYANDQSFFPPLAMDRTELTPDTLRHPIDAFFRPGPNGFSTVGRAVVAGRNAVVIEGRVETPRRDGQPAYAERVRAYLDAERGALPLRIEWFDEARNSTTPKKVLETTEIVSVGGGFYPAKGFLRKYGPDPRRADEAEPVTANTTYVVLDELTWDAAKIEANLPLTETFAPPIPKGTYYYDETRGTTVRSGYEDVNHARLPWTLCGGLVVGWAAYGMIALVRATLGRRRSGVEGKLPELSEAG